jgi:hypothetical protein
MDHQHSARTRNVAAFDLGAATTLSVAATKRRIRETSLAAITPPSQ